MQGSLSTRLVKRTIDGGTLYRTATLSVRYLPGDEYRYTPVVSKKQGNAVQRNRVKRVIRGIMSTISEGLPNGYYLIYFKGPCRSMNRRLIEDNLTTIAKLLPASEKNSNR